VQAARRQLFVGREAELAQLRTAYDAAAAGHASLAVVPGEPGIGKTALCEQLARYVDEHGGRTLVGHCYPEGSVRLPYLPIVEALRAYVAQRDAAGLEVELGAGAPDVARILPELRELLHVELRASLDPEDAAWALLEAISGFLRAASLRQPILLVLEDVHDADRATLDVLLHIGRNLAGAQLLLIATYRDVEVTRTHPLSATLGELRRSPHFDRVPLRGLAVSEVHHLCCSTADTDIPWTRAEAIQRHTEGNPLFVHEVLRNTPDALEYAIPEGLRDAVGKTLSRLTASCDALLSTAAVIGPEFELAVLQSVSGMDENTALAALEEAVRAGLLHEQVRPGSIHYRFAHAFFRQTLYEELIAPRRLRLHQRVARMLETRYAAHLDEHAAELAEHFAHSTDTDDLRKSIEYSERAARCAVAVYAYGEAARILERAVQTLDVLEPEDPAERCDLLLELGETLIPAGEPRRAADDIAPLAWDLAHALDDTRRASRAAQLGLEAVMRHGGAVAQRTDVYRDWAERADRFAAPGTLERVHADHALGSYKSLIGEQAEADRLLDRATDLARRLGDSDALFRSAAYGVLFADTPSRSDLRLRLIDELADHPRDGISHGTLGTFLSFAQRCYLEHGNRVRFEQLGRELARIAERSRNASLVWRPLVTELILNTLDGKREDALASAAHVVARAQELGVGMLGCVHAYPYSARARWCLGIYVDADVDAFMAQTRWAPLLEVPITVARGQREEARALVRAYVADLAARGDAAEGHLVDLAPSLEAAIMLGDFDLVEPLVHQLTPAAKLFGAPGTGFTSVARLLGKAAVILGQRDAARVYFEQALELCQPLRYRPEAALVHLELAELLLAQGQSGARSAAIEHLDLAISEMTEMHMRPHLERALSLQRQTHAQAAPGTGGLSAREREVAALVGRGLSNRAIAETLVISEGTAEVHVKRILSKLGFRSRAQIAVWSVESAARSAGG
jgi:DNA-binding CsgD family transcriptional regulator